MLLGQQVSPQVAQSIEQSLSDNFPAGGSGGGALPATGPNWTWADLLYGMEYGNVPPDVKAQIQQQAIQSDIQAGADPNVAAATDPGLITAALNDTTLPGAFGITWTGANPGGTNWVTQAEANAASALGLNTGTWIWWALGGVGALFLLSRMGR